MRVLSSALDLLGILRWTFFVLLMGVPLWTNRDSLEKSKAFPCAALNMLPNQ